MKKNDLKPRLLNLLCLLGLFVVSCGTGKDGKQVVSGELLPIEKAIIETPENFFYVDIPNYTIDKNLPIGVFDSGTGGLTILNTLLDFDAFDNLTGDIGADGKQDFVGEKFIYLADQANMPYGNYYAEDNSELLLEHILKDAQFLLSDKYYEDVDAPGYRANKERIKAMVIACNTATAYGKENITEFLEKAKLPLKIIGVIDAGARGALEKFGKDESGSIAVFATVGTIASKGYENTLKKFMEELGYSGDIQIFNQGGHGIAEAVDGEPDYILPGANTPRTDYRGPSLDHPDFKIDKMLMDVYNFDFDHGKMLCDAGDTDDCRILQINSTENYVRYHLVSMMEKIRQSNNPQPLKVVMLGCTHYPYLEEEIAKVLEELYDYQINGEYIYRPLMAVNMSIVDPAVNVAHELYAFLQEQDLINPSGNMEDSEFFISVPNIHNPAVQLDQRGRFTYDYKYRRRAGEVQEYVKRVPFSKKNIPEDMLSRLAVSIPTTYELITVFNQKNPKLNALSVSEKIR